VIHFPQAFPLLPDTKRPAVKWSDPATCGPTETAPAGVRYGLPTGPRNGVWVLDVDRKPGQPDGLISLVTHAASREPLPDTYTVRTPSGGLHLYFRWDDARPVGNPVGVLPGVDVRGDRGYVCAGGDYVVVLDAPLADAPEWLLELATKKNAGPVDAAASAVAIAPDHPEWDARLRMGSEFIAGEPPCVEGEGKSEAQCFKMALRLSRTYELPPEISMELLAPYFARCQPAGYIRDKMSRALVRAAEVGQGPTGTFAAGSALLAPFAQGTVQVPDDGPWRQIKDPKHVHSEDLATSCAGGASKSRPITPKELAAILTGPAAVPPWRGVWQYDVFRRRVTAVNPPFRLDAETMGISRRDMSRMQVWLEGQGGKTSLEVIANAIDFAASQCEFHPVRDYLDSLEKVPAAQASAYFEGIAGRLWGATDRNELESGHLRRLAIAAVRRIRVPGTKVDTMIVLAGDQGYRKSLMCAKLFGDYFLDQVPPIGAGRGHEASIAIEGRWGIEIGEMNAFDRATEGAKKEFITRCVDKYRPVFGMAVQEVPRQCVFIGTTNEDDFLTDPTGDTRYDICDIRQPINLDALDRDAFWAAASALEAAGEPHWRDRAALARAKSAELFGNGGVNGASTGESAGYSAEDPWTDVVLKYAASAAALEPSDGLITAQECIARGLVIPTEKQDARVQKRVRNILRRAYGASHVAWIDGRSQRVYRVV
jgi:virulence-associated protein E/bifunctional DNA primase/polymerase-like protein